MSGGDTVSHLMISPEPSWELTNRGTTATAFLQPLTSQHVSKMSLRRKGQLSENVPDHFNCTMSLIKAEG